MSGAQATAHLALQEHARPGPGAASEGTRDGQARTGGTLHAKRVLLVEQAFIDLPGGPAYGPSEIAEATGLNVTVVYRILQSGLDTATFVRVPPGRYRLGPGAAKLGMQAMASTPGPETSRPLLQRLSRIVDGFAMLTVLSPYGGPRQVCIDTAPGRWGFDALGLTATQLMEISTSLRVGAAGRVIAAHLPPPLAKRIIRQPPPAGAGPGALHDPHTFAASLPRTRRAGYAVGRQEIPGWDAVAAPVLWGDAVYGAVSVLKPSAMMAKDLALPVAATRATAERLTQLLSDSGAATALAPPPVRIGQQHRHR
ncbi:MULTISPECIES: IclR family transcriptional regulator [unclassified Streptomyces]|uniref:IclR family transcriptional regulator n=1 Tax=unclassified Streptomyces TaxID=2593676 RepID=UPI00074A5DB8|nr:MULTISPECIES: IclR family transcriptional regulator C-terminal domain-containing protein [unclassified Streptomyces]KUL74364.1 hypothetical protein ADL33_17875 [Streptomyces sp. NRRL WC-3604]